MMIPIKIRTQPNDETCGATSLHAIYNYYDHKVSLKQLISEIDRSVSGGTLSPYLGKHALLNGFEVCIYVNNLNLFDPSWFGHEDTPPDFLINKLRTQRPFQTDEGLLQESLAYESFIEFGGLVRFQTMNRRLLRKYFHLNIPILTGLSSTYLYRTPRERFSEKGESIYDDIQGKPCGHFVVLCGYDSVIRSVVVADPFRSNPISGDNYYKIPITHLMNAILLGVYTYDANLLIIYPKGMGPKDSKTKRV